MLIRGVLVFLMISISAVVLSAQAPDPDALVASVEKAATALAKAQKAGMCQGQWDTYNFHLV